MAATNTRLAGESTEASHRHAWALPELLWRGMALDLARNAVQGVAVPIHASWLEPDCEVHGKWLSLGCSTICRRALPFCGDLQSPHAKFFMSQCIMPMTCTVCVHPNRVQIERAIIAGTPLRTIAGQFGPSKTSLMRHRPHVAEPIARSTEACSMVRANTLTPTTCALASSGLSPLLAPRKSWLLR